MKTAISLPDDVFRDADKLAKRLRKSRSELYREAVTEYLARHEPEAITEALDRLVDETSVQLDKFGAAAAHGILRATEW
jgi:Arc/MetJ-type ribon-helix-helix transcriptional regulator